jgi:Trypsin-co-occurring domain 1
MAQAPDGIRVTFGLDLHAEAGAFIAAASTTATFTVELTWAQP